MNHIIARMHLMLEKMDLEKMLILLRRLFCSVLDEYPLLHFNVALI